MTPDDIAARVRRVWESRGLTQARFAEQVEMEESAFSRSLNRQRRFTSVELARIAQLTGASIDWLVTGGDGQPVATAARLHDTSAGVSIDVARSSADELGQTAATLVMVGTSLDVPPLPPVPARRGRDVDVAEQLAETALAWIEEYEGVVPTAANSLFFADLPRLMEDVFGINVAVLHLGRGFDGLSWVQGDFRLALLNNALNWTRQRYTLAHEVGHILFGDSQVLHVDQDVTQRADDGSERRASAFAAAFLMPAPLVRSTVTGPLSQDAFCAVVGRFNVSPSALAWRLWTLRLVSEAERDQFRRLTSNQAAELGGWADRYAIFAAQQAQTRPPGPLASAALRSFAAGRVSARIPAGILGIDPLDLLPDERDGSEEGASSGFDFVP